MNILTGYLAVYKGKYLQSASPQRGSCRANARLRRWGGISATGGSAIALFPCDRAVPTSSVARGDTFPSQGKDFCCQAFFSESAKNAFQTQTPEVWRDRRPSIINPQGELCPPEEKFCGASLAMRESKFHSSRILRPKISAEILAKSANPKTPRE